MDNVTLIRLVAGALAVVVSVHHYLAPAKKRRGVETDRFEI